jgi:formylglycine-generating enzyme required for sulfatase activity/calcineurin-like phosphoesterase family protein/energy-coupling factor transporter ATP-binding protein EcfA2
MSEITILHLSDIHFKKKKEEENMPFRQLVQERLIEAIATHKNEHGSPNFVAITGDIAFSGKEHEYREAAGFFDKLKKVLQGKTEFLAVPGNHDVDRDVVDDCFPLGESIVKKNLIDKFLEDQKKVKDFITVKFKAYRGFIERLNPMLYESKTKKEKEKGKEKEKYFWVKNFPGKNVSFLGLNGAWASEGDNDRFNIALGFPQVIRALEESKDIPNRVVLMHHPLFEWLEEKDMSKCRGEIFDRCGLILHGHVHIDRADCISTPSDSCICLGANASYTHDGHIGFQFIRVFFREDQNDVQVRIWPYILDDRERLAFFPDTRRWRGQKGKDYFDLETRRPHGAEENETLSPLHIPAQYRDWVLQFHSRMETQQLDPNASAIKVPLPELYIPIETVNPYYKPRAGDERAGKEAGKEIGIDIFEIELEDEKEGEGKEPAFIDIEALLGRQECILLRGPAGMGKTTLIKHLAYTITQGGGPVSLCGHLPVVVFLKDLWPIYEKARDAKTMGTTFKSLLDIYLQSRVSGLDMEVVDRFLSRNRALVLLDGLDEVPGHLRPDLVEMIAGFRLEHRNNRFLLTGRPHGVDAAAKAHFGEYLRDIELLDDRKIKEFIHNWFRAVSGQAEGLAKVTAADMVEDIEFNEPVKVFTHNPLLLTAVCILYLDNQRLPNQRAELYCRIVDNLVYRRFSHLKDDARARIEDYLRLLAFVMQEGNLKIIETGAARELLKEVFKPQDNETTTAFNRRIHGWFEEIEPRCGLLNRQGEGEIEFFHLTFQEFLAARHIFYTETGYKQFLEKGWWEETLLLYAGLISREWKDKANRMVNEILTHPPGEDETGNRRIWLMGCKALRDIPGYKRDSGVLTLAREKLQRIIAPDISASLEQRFEAGEILGILGDPRINVLKPPMVLVEASEFIRGSEEDDSEKPVRNIYLDKFMIGKYPVTNQEFKAFIEDGGYKNKVLWTPEGWHWREKANVLEPGLWHDRKWNGANFPVVEVSWYEASAYAKWLSVKTGHRYVLPSEAQWEKAARGSGGFAYPWGENWKEDYCNSVECGLMRTSLVGIFPKGKSPYGCMDMAGNVWEWCADWYEEDYYKKSPVRNPQGPKGGSGRVIRGGSWGHARRRCRGAYRGIYAPVSRGSGLGFRLSRLL